MSKKKKAESEVTTQSCPECGLMNPGDACECDVCGAAFTDDQTDREKRLWDLNAELMEAVKAEDQDKIGDLKLIISEEVAKTDGEFVVDSNGYAMKPSSDRPPNLDYTPRNSKPTLIEFVREKETKNCVRYEEVPDGRPIIGYLYVRKEFFGEEEVGRLTVTLTKE